MFAASARLDVRRFFQVTSVLLIVFAAGLVAHGVHEFQEAGVFPILIEHVWDINPILGLATWRQKPAARAAEIS
jgi:high-affinity iron transporter